MNPYRSIYSTWAIVGALTLAACLLGWAWCAFVIVGLGAVFLALGVLMTTNERANLASDQMHKIWKIPKFMYIADYCIHACAIILLVKYHYYPAAIALVLLEAMSTVQLVRRLNRMKKNVV